MVYGKKGFFRTNKKQDDKIVNTELNDFKRILQSLSTAIQNLIREIESNSMDDKTPNEIRVVNKMWIHIRRKIFDFEREEILLLTEDSKMHINAEVEVLKVPIAGERNLDILERLKKRKKILEALLKNILEEESKRNKK